jgi:Phosphotransferase enzyme family
MLESIARQFFQIEHWHGAAPIGNGHINDTYRIDFQANGRRQTFVLQRLNHHVFRQPEAVMTNWQAVARHLATADFPLEIPVPVPTLGGQLLHFETEAHPSSPVPLRKESFGHPSFWRVFPFFENTFSPETAATPALAFEAARAYGAFVRALADFPAGSLAEVIPGFHDTEQRWRVFEKTLAENPVNRLENARPEIAEMLAARPIFQKISHLKTSGALPLRVTHNDTKAGNVLLDRDSGRAVAVIDWDTVMPGTVLSDFGDMVRSFAPDRPENDPDTASLALRHDVMAAMREGFLSETADFLTETERENLDLGGLWIVGEQALRFLTDYLAGDVYYKVTDPALNLTRARNQLALLRKLVG